MGVDKHHDVIIIGSGVIGLFIAYFLSKSDLDILVLERNMEVGLGISKAHAGVLHVIQLPFKSLKSKLAVKGNLMYNKICRELGVGIKRINALLLATNIIHYLTMPIIYLYLKLNLGSQFPMKIVFRRSSLLKYEKNISGKVLGGIVVGGYGVVDSFELLYSLYRFARENGVEFRFGVEVNDIEVNGGYVKVYTETDVYVSRFVVNSAGLQADKLASKIGDEIEFEYGKGTMIIFSDHVSDTLISPLYLKPDPRTKGGGIIPTIDGKSIWGPNLTEVSSEHDVSVKEEDINMLLTKFIDLVVYQPTKMVKAYSGIRPITLEHDFIIRYSRKTSKVIHVAGIGSPGLTAAPAIAEMVAKLLEDAGLELREKQIRFPRRSLYVREKLGKGKALPRKDYIICPYNVVSRDDVKNAVKDGAATLQGLFFRTRLGFDEGQMTIGVWRAVKVMAEELGTTPDKITLKGGESWLVRRY